MLYVIEKHSDHINHQIYFYKYFANYGLLVNLADEYVKAIGTV